MSTISSELVATLSGCPEQLIVALPGLIERTAPGRAWADQAQHAAKRAIDIIGAACGLVLLSPLLIVVTVLIRIESRGSVLFRQTRLGLNGRPFLMYKFRTMIVNAEAHLAQIEHLNESGGGVLFKVKRDPRVTRLGRILRRTSLDELPQLINVLRGEMSLVGPRPLQLRDCKLLAQAALEGFVRRHTVLPGLTGSWQVSDRSETGFTHLIQLDLEYIDQWSLGLDLRLLFQTVAAVVCDRGLC